MVDPVTEIRRISRGFRHLGLTPSGVGLGTLIAVLRSLRSHDVDMIALSGIVAAGFFLASTLCFSMVRVSQPWMPVVRTASVRVHELEAQVGRCEALASPVELDHFGLSHREV